MKNIYWLTIRTELHRVQVAKEDYKKQNATNVPIFCIIKKKSESSRVPCCSKKHAAAFQIVLP